MNVIKNKYGQNVGKQVNNPPIVLGTLIQDKFFGHYVELHRIEPSSVIDDLYLISHGQGDKESVWTYMGYGPFDSKSSMLAWLNSIEDSSEYYYYSIKDIETDKYVGMISIMSIDLTMGRFELGNIWYGREYHGSNINTDVIFTLLEHGFNTCKARRIEWKCDSLNDKSKNAAVRLGFSPEGVFKNHLVYKGRTRDTAWFSIIDVEWPVIRENYLAWYKGGQSLKALNAQLTRNND
ncbi:N-acetyltransferase [Vibrio sp. T187]|uniref:GNAT family N-acetyltransferase n=1 Tax=Vibrio TaxID=662 RepID=UPI0010CA0C1D|nr:MULTISPECIES: GNAT family protein [Vibrio]MBW3696751.1 N-acetyltransferase [Vibrio sp. T187]